MNCLTLHARLPLGAGMHGAAEAAAARRRAGLCADLQGRAPGPRALRVSCLLRDLGEQFRAVEVADGSIAAARTYGHVVLKQSLRAQPLKA